jgi:hydrogenase maturation protein HypF
MLAVGGHLKDTVAVSVGKQVFISQHIGDLETPEALRGLENATAQLLRLYDVKPHCVACDAHPSYGSSQFARRLGLRLVEVQHHYAHVLACMAENDLEGPVLGVSWDGTGYGSDGAVWGGEFLLVRDSGFERAAHLAVFPLPGGETAIREPRRAALGVLYQMFGPAAFEMAELRSLRSFSPPERKILRRMLEKGLNTPLTSSAGRIFDAVASLCGLRQVNAFEGQAAMELEFAANGSSATEAYGFRLLPAGDSRETPALIDWTPTLRAIVEELSSGTPPADVSARFHSTLGEMIVAAARLVGVERVALTGGCFQNRRLTEGAVRRLREEGFQPYWHQRVPPNDGGIALGQLLAAAGAGV